MGHLELDSEVVAKKVHMIEGFCKGYGELWNSGLGKGASIWKAT